jgi:VCBS repeat protein
MTQLRAALAAALSLCAACGSGRITAGPPRAGSSTGGQTNPVCAAGANPGKAQAPVFVRNVPGQTGWFASPIVSDLGGGGMKVVAASYTLDVYDAAGRLLDSAPGNGQRIYAPHVVTDLEGDGIVDIIVGQGRQVFAYEWTGGRLRLKAGWPVDTTTAGESPEVRGLAAADLDGDGLVEVVATTTQTQPAAAGGAQVFVFSHDGRPYQPVATTTFPAWPRYNALTGPGGDADRNGAGHDGYGCYGLNVAIGNVDDDPALEIVVTYDNHEIQVFKADGTAIDAAPWFTNPQTAYAGERLTWGQFIRWADPAVEEAHYHLHTGAWPDPGAGQEWLQWTASPPNVVDLDGDGRAEVVGIPNVEKGDPYVTQAYAVMVLQGAHGDGSRSAMRLPGWETLPRGERPVVSGDYPPVGVPAAATVDIQGDARPEIVASLNDGYLYAFDAGGARLWRHDYTHGKPVMYASEPAIADLDQDGSPEIVFTTYGAPGVRDSGHLVVLAADGALLHDVPLPNPGQDGNGNGAPAAPTIADLDGDGQLEILVQTFDHGLDVFTVPGSAANCLLWTTARGGPLRMGAPNGNAAPR